VRWKSGSCSPAITTTRSHGGTGLIKDDWDALERELRKFIEELKQGDRNDFPDLDPNVQVPFVRLVLEECSKGRELTEGQRQAALSRLRLRRGFGSRSS